MDVKKEDNMANFKYKTRGNGNPQGKPRVYFCCHPEDFNRYFESISNEILSKQNCAIWYTDEVAAKDEDFFIDLKQMQLFVMPVTTNLLCTENDAMDIEFKFAVENHIPVLPLMQENGLEELFNKKCGDLQFLDKNNADTTAISYDDKLQKYLETVLVGDELAEKIRAAFDAYVFLSYRKKDRKYAQELMRLIHKNEFCRDIAIWYDEFLTPGENFNDSIKEAIKKSGLFVLAVTPNLINEQNYIMTTEYPMAKKEGKQILPTELVPTDKEELSKKYEGLPKCTNAYDDSALSESLIAVLGKIAIRENDSSKEHKFFIGLAYLSGIDVEVDYEKALFLIKSAADEGLLEAVKKLVVIYSRGVGVKRNISEAIFWQEKVVSKLDLDDESNYDEYILLANLNKEIGSYKKAKNVLCSLIAQNTAITKQGVLSLARAFLELGDIEIETAVLNPENAILTQVEIGTYENAEQYYRLSVSFFLKANDYDEVGNDERIDINEFYLRLSKLLYKQEQYSRAREYLVIILDNVDNEDTVLVGENGLRLSEAYNLMGDISLAIELYEESLSYYRKAHELGDYYCREYQKMLYPKIKGRYERSVAKVYSCLGDISSAVEHYQEAINVYLREAELNGLYGDWAELANTYDDLSHLFERESKEQKAAEYAQLCYEARLKCIQQESDSPLVLEEGAKQIFRLFKMAEEGKLSLDIKEMSPEQLDLKDKYEREIENAAEVLDAQQTEEALLTWCSKNRDLAKLYKEIEGYGDAALIFRNVIHVLKKWYDDRFSFVIRGLLCGYYFHLSEAYRQMYKMESCMDYQVEGMKILERIQGEYEHSAKVFEENPSKEEADLAIKDMASSAESGFVEALEFMVNSYLTGTYTGKNIFRAIEWQQKLVERRFDLHILHFDSNDNEKSYLTSLIDLADIYATAKCADEALDTYEHVFEYQKEKEEIVKKCSRIVFKDQFEKLAKNANEEGRLEDAKDYYEIALNKCLPVGENEDKKEIEREGVWYYELGQICSKLGRADNASENYKKAIEKFLVTGNLYLATEAMLDVADIQFRKKNYIEAEKYYVEVVKYRDPYLKKNTNPNNPFISDVAIVHRQLGFLYDCMNKFDDAERELKTVITLYLSMKKPQSYSLSKVYIRLADMFNYLKRYDEALCYYNETVELCLKLLDEVDVYEPLLADAYDGLASVYRKLDKMDVAKGFKEKALSIASRYPDDSDCKHIKPWD